MKSLTNILLIAVFVAFVSSLNSCASRKLLLEEEYYDMTGYDGYNEQTYRDPTYQRGQQQAAPKKRPRQEYQPAQANDPIRPSAQNYANTSPFPRIVEEKISNLSDSNILNRYNLVCGSFKSKQNSDDVMAFLYNEGYNPLTIYDPKLRLYRVICGSFHDIKSALFFKKEFTTKYASQYDFSKAWMFELN